MPFSILNGFNKCAISNKRSVNYVLYTVHYIDPEQQKIFGNCSNSHLMNKCVIIVNSNNNRSQYVK